VARHAGVALGTVSNALNNPDKLAPSTLNKVQAAMEELGFVRNRLATSLAAGTGDLIGFVIVDIGNSLFVDIARGAERAAKEQDFKLMLANSDVDLERQDAYLKLFDESRVSGVLLAPLDAPLDGAAGVRSHGRPVVLVNWPGQENESCGVTVDEEYGGYLAAKHLIEQGCRSLLFAGGPLGLTAVRERLIGAQRAIRESGTAVRFELLETERLTVPAGLEVGRALSRRPAAERPDGIFAAADALAAGCAQALLYAGISIPGDVAIIGYDDNHFTADHVVPISTVGQPGPEMGRIALELLIDEIRNPHHLHETVVLQPALIARTSTARV
jgi:LacI family transcriptional regulator